MVLHTNIYFCYLSKLIAYSAACQYVSEFYCGPQVVTICWKPLSSSHTVKEVSQIKTIHNILTIQNQTSIHRFKLLRILNHIFTLFRKCVYNTYQKGIKMFSLYCIYFSTCTNYKNFPALTVL